MSDLPSIPDVIPQVQAPHSPVSPADISAPYNALAKTLDLASEKITEDVAKPLARQAGLKAVTRDADGNVQVQQLPIMGPASDDFVRAVKFSAVANGEGTLKRDDIELRQEFRDNPEGYRIAADAYKDKVVANYTKLAGPEVGITLGKLVDGQTTTTYRGLLNEHERLTLQRADKSMESGIQSARDDLVAMARGGVTSGPAWDQARDKISTLTDQRVANPRLAYPKEQADYDMQHLDGELKANGFLYHVDQVYKDQSSDPKTGEQNGGPAKALETAKDILTDPSVKLTAQQREAFYHKAVGEVRANEAERRQDLYLTRAAATDLKTASSLGLTIEPEMVDKVAQQFYKQGDPGSAARVYAWAGRAPLNDDFGRQPLSEQTKQLQNLRTGFQGTPENAAAVKQAAANLGIAPRDLAAAISYETKGTFNPGIVGGTGNNYRGLIQFGPEERKQFGVTPDQSFPDQMKSVEGFLRARGVKPGMGLSDVYRTINGGNPNAPLNASDGNGTIAEHIQRIQSGHYGNADRFLGDAPGPAPDPASSLWLTSNRQRMVQSEASTAWTSMMKEWNANGVAPNNKAVMDVVNAARATGNHNLLEQIGYDMDRVQTVQTAAQGPLAGQHAAIEELRRQSAAGDIEPGNAMVLKQLAAKNDAIEKGLADNPIATATANFPDRLKSPAPLNIADPNAFRAGLQQRAGIAQFAAQNWQIPAPAALDKTEVQAVHAALESADPATKARIFSDITAAIPDDKVRNATFAKLSKEGTHAGTQAYAGALYAQAPDVAASILRGQTAIKADDRNDPSKEGEGRTAFNDSMDKVLPQGAFSLAGRTDPTGPYAVMRNATVARYADLTAQSGGDKKFSETRLKQAVDDVTGGILTQNGGKFLAPARGMPQATFDRVLYGVTDQDLAGVTTLAGEPVTRDYLRGSAQLESYGDGRYLVRLGKDAAKPVYAVHLDPSGAEQPAPFILDLRGRQPADKPPPGGDLSFKPYPRG